MREVLTGLEKNSYNSKIDFNVLAKAKVQGDQYEEITAYSGRCPGHIQYRMRQETLESRLHKKFCKCFGYHDIQTPTI